MMPRTGRYGRVRQLIEILLRDKTAFAEVLSGVFLVLLRGLLLVGAPKIVGEGSEVAHLLATLAITEPRWGTVLMVLGALQVWLAGEHRSGWRVAVNGLIVLAFASLIGGFLLAYGLEHVPASLVCMFLFETFLLGRVGDEWWDGGDAGP